MKKSNAINLVLITAAIAACNRPLYQQRPDGYEDPGYSAGAPADSLTAGPGLASGPDPADSTNSCPVESSELPPDYYDWYNAAGFFGSFTVNLNINGYYAYRNPPPLVRVNPIRSFFARAFANIPHPMTQTHPTVVRSGFGARAGMAVHS